MKSPMKYAALAAACATVLSGGLALASSHREAPNITKTPKVDNTDVYLFRSYEQGRSGYVTLLANFQPSENPVDGPNYYLMDQDARYSIHIDNNGDAKADLTFAFRFRNHYRHKAVAVDGKRIAVPLSNIGPFQASQDQNLNVLESYVVRTVRRHGPARLATNLQTHAHTFIKPFDNIGTKSIPDYPAYAGKYITPMAFDGCSGQGRVFVGQRKEGFAVNTGEIFDLVHTNPLGPRDGEKNALADKNVTTIALEIPISCLTNGSPIIGAWSTASLPMNSTGKGRGLMRQVSRLSAPLVNEVVIGLPDKDRFNSSLPRNDAQFAKYVTHPSMPELIQALFPTVTAPNHFPREDLVAAFLTGIDGLNKPASVRPAEMMRLNTSIAPKPASQQDSLGVLAGDTAGFPNGRRPGDDVVDIELRVLMGVLLSAADAPSGQLPFTDGAAISATQFCSKFPYLNTPIPGATDD